MEKGPVEHRAQEETSELQPDEEAAVQQVPNQLLVVSAAEFFRNHPAMLGSVMYLVITSMGMVYAACLYRKFGTNILDFAELNDFLLAAFKDLVAFIMSIVTITLGIGATVWLSFQAETLRQEKNIAAGRLGLVARHAHLNWATGLIILSIFIYTLVPPYLFGNSEATSIMEAQEAPVEVRYRTTTSGSAPLIPEKGVEFIGATDKAAFFYDAEAKRTLVIPHSKIVSIAFPESDPGPWWLNIGLPRAIWKVVD
jgi:hypothetical protein